MFYKRLWTVTVLTAFLFSFTACDKKNPIKEVSKIPVTDTASPILNNSADNEATTEAPTSAPVMDDIPSIAGTMTKETYPSVDGSTATIPLSAAIYRFATGASKEEADAKIVHTKTTNAYLSLISGDSDLLIAYEPSGDVYDALGETNVKLNMKPVGRDALVFLANKTNPVKSLTKEQLIRIYEGKITNWSSAGGPDQKIIAFQRPETSGSQTLMRKLVMKDTPMMEAPGIMKPSEMADLINALADYANESNALGYSVYYYTQNMYNLPDIRYMAVDGIEPDINTIKNNSYPYINEFYTVIREDEPADSNAHKIFDWLTGAEGQNLIEELGYVPVK